MFLNANFIEDNQGVKNKLTSYDKKNTMTVLYALLLMTYYVENECILAKFKFVINVLTRCYRI